ncbi:uncharacterized protein LOC116770685 [Danaus plexippus]|uniref:uncharacterized protein LOC116770685 n=1 Tax=Danaus plexippus TaxID=13037 RepID=UPI002AAF9A9A|nr:uncharacterized protein LOC116770685 [Danaus plexippus]XP_061376738.1 uncharacterized protein LOC116770685 [Danaus plexippus]
MATVLHRRALRVVNKGKLFLPTLSRDNSTEKHILRSDSGGIEKPRQTVTEFVWQNLDKWPDKTLAVCAVTGRGYTYAQTHRLSVSFAASLLKKLKLQHNDKVAIVLPNVPEYPAIAFGILEAGCIASMMNPAYTVDELKHQIKLVECKAIVASKLSYPNLYKALQELKMNIPVILIDNEDLPENTIKFAELAENTDTDILKSVKRNIKDTAILPFSSGTTGFPKAVELTHESICALNSMILTPGIIAVQEATASFQPVLPAVLPLFHIFGFNVLMVNLMSRGVKLVTMPAFKPELYLDTLIRQKANHLYIVPPMAIFLGKHPAVTPRHLDSVIDIICGAASLSSGDAMAIIEKNKNLIFRQGYGLTETNGGVAIGYNDNTNHDAVGFPFPSSEIKIADLSTQQALGPGQEGEIWYRGLNVMKGYYKNEAATKEVLTEDGWFKTGDVGKYDENKYLYITDRIKELIKVKGFQVAPAELETVLRSHPKILDCAVLGIPDPFSGEVPKAFVVVQPGQNIKGEEVLEHVNSKLTQFKKIKEVQFVDAIPKNPAGKIMRRQLKEKYC